MAASADLIEHCRIAVLEQPEEETRWLAYGQCLLDTGRAADALKTVEEARRSGHNSPRLEKLRQDIVLSLNETAARSAITSSAESGAGWKALGVVLQIRQQYPEATLMLEKAVSMLPGDGEAAIALGFAHDATGQLQAAAACFERGIELLPGSYLGHYGRASALAKLARLEEAEKSYLRAVELAPGDPNLLADYGRLLNALRRPLEAEARAREALRLHADHPLAHNVLGNALSMQRRYGEAVDAGRRSVALQENDPIYRNDLGATLTSAGLNDEAELHLRRVVEVAPAMHVAWLNLGIVNSNRSRYREANACFEKALELKPELVEAHGMRGVVLQQLGRIAEAEAEMQAALKLDPDSFHSHNNLGNLYQAQGRLDEAARCFEKAMSLKPDLAEALSNLLFCHSHDERVGPEQLFAEHALFGERFETPLKARWPDHPNDRDPDRPLRVGFVSGDLRNHAVASFIEPIFEYFAGSKSIHVHAYSNWEAEDAVSARLRKHVVQWRKVIKVRDEELCARIRDDQIDILIDLSGHTGKYRLRALARKPAPLQASWIGYPGTTGLTAMDYYFADRHFLPPGKFDDQFVEKIVHLPAVVAFRPEGGAPDVCDLPALANGYITFGSFNRLSKISESTLVHWAALLRAIPNSRMLIAGMPLEEGYRDPRFVLREHGIDPARLRLQPRSSVPRYLQLHQEVDVCLDTFGYTGGTTTLYALWMGVPTLTFAGPTPAGRQGAAIMQHMGLSAYVANSGDDFLKRGKRIAKDLERLAKLRADLRARMQASALGRPEKVAAGLEKALRAMWKRWCAGLPPESFEVR